MGRILFIVLVISGFAVAIGIANKESFAMMAPEQDAVIADAVATTAENFNETGTLVFYPNNVGPVPYLFYQDQESMTVAKALVFPDQSPNAFSSWTGARVSVSGDLVAEHVVVTNIIYIYGP